MHFCAFGVPCHNTMTHWSSPIRMKVRTLRHTCCAPHVVHHCAKEVKQAKHFSLFSNERTWCAPHNTLNLSTGKLFQNWEWYFLMDPVSFNKIRSRATHRNKWRNLFIKNQVNILEWPETLTQSDLNPIEILWSTYKQWLCGMDRYEYIKEYYYMNISNIWISFIMKKTEKNDFCLQSLFQLICTRMYSIWIIHNLLPELRMLKC